MLTVIQESLGREVKIGTIMVIRGKNTLNLEVQVNIAVSTAKRNIIKRLSIENGSKETKRKAAGEMSEKTRESVKKAETVNGERRKVQWQANRD
jgi:hypothetical protein